MRRQYLANGKPEGCESYRTVSELAEYLGVSSRTVERWYRDRKIPEPVLITGKGWKLWHPNQVGEILSAELQKRRIK